MPLNSIQNHYYLSGAVINRKNGQESGSESIRSRAKVRCSPWWARLTLNWCDSSTLCYCICFLSQWFLSCYKLHGTVTLLKPRCQTAVLLHIYLFVNYPQKYPRFRLLARLKWKFQGISKCSLYSRTAFKQVLSAA